jgi:alpha-D-ribose 1-methylphosphonate 5-phosphate C-P lyase
MSNSTQQSHASTHDAPELALTSNTQAIQGYNYGYLDEQTKRMIRRAILKAVAITGYQVPFCGREMPMPYGWGQATYRLLRPLSAQTTPPMRYRFANSLNKVAHADTTEKTDAASIIQTRHRIPERPLKEGQILVYQAPIPEPLRFLEPRETETRKMHALSEYGIMHVKLYEDIARYGHISTSYAYPVKVNQRYIMDPYPIPKFDKPKMDRMSALQLFRAGREKRIYAIPPFTDLYRINLKMQA